ncbi:hypothetical protein ACFWPU_46320 [Streptomyces sp. NPDC058471]|uniref:hypothetical protein n=1 Tax=Streptomyces sp. NPDC058471 TaxID=3346516 RepID=UPI00365CC70F
MTTNLTRIDLITCCTDECAIAPTPLFALPSRTFACVCGHELAPADVVPNLDGGRLWAVDPTGALGWVIDPTLSLEVIAEALDELAESGGSKYAARAALDKAYAACADYVAAYHVGIA